MTTSSVLRHGPRPAVFGLLLACMAALAPTPALAQTRQPDFNGDGFADLAIGVFKEDVDGIANAGAVNIIYGSAAGLDEDGNQFIHQNTAGTPGILDSAEAGDGFGSVLGWGDFNGDGYSDLAVGIPNEDIAAPGGVRTNAGAVAVIYGSTGGLDPDSDGGGEEDNQFWHQDQDEVGDVAENGDAFGSALAIGDFDGDGFDDLAIAARGEDLPGAANAGAVIVLHGSLDGLTDDLSLFIHQDSFDVQGIAGSGDGFGGALAAGDFDDDGFDDLAVGVKNEDLGIAPFPIKSNVGAVQVFYGSPASITATGDQFWTQDSVGIADIAETGDFFGSALAAGDFDDDGFDDLAIGVPGQKVSTHTAAGAVHILYGNLLGLSDVGDQVWTQDSPGPPVVTNSAAADESFGAALASGDFDGDAACDLAIGVPGQAVAGIARGGALHILYGTITGLRTSGNQFLSQNTVGVLDAAETGDELGKDFTAADFDGDGFDDLAFGVKNESAGATIAAGAVGVMYSVGAGGLDVAGNQLWTQDSAGILDECESDDRFGDL
jgi:hypothetical protein